MHSTLDLKMGVRLFHNSRPIERKNIFSFIDVLLKSEFDYSLNWSSENVLEINIKEVKFFKLGVNYPHGISDEYVNDEKKLLQLHYVVEIKEFYASYKNDLYRYIRYNYLKDEFDYTSIIKLIGLLQLKTVEIKNPDEMLLKLKEECLVEPQSIFSNQQERKTHIVSYSIQEMLGHYSDNKITLCPENIQKTFQLYQEKYPEEWGDDVSLLIKKVFYHELGHLIFDKLNPRTINSKLKEKQANYIASCATSGMIDYQIKQMTLTQSSDYQDPLLSLHFYIFEKNNCTSKKPIEKLNDFKSLVKDYSIEVVKLYKGE